MNAKKQCKILHTVLHFQVLNFMVSNCGRVKNDKYKDWAEMDMFSRYHNVFLMLCLKIKMYFLGQYSFKCLSHRAATTLQALF